MIVLLLPEKIFTSKTKYDTVLVGGIMARNRRNKREVKKVVQAIPLKTFLVLLVILIMIILACLLIIFYRNKQEKQLLTQQREELDKAIFAIYEETERNIANSNETVRDAIIRISAVGDILCGNEMLADAYHQETETYDFSPMFQNITSFISRSDIVVGTMETNFTENNYSGYGNRNSPKEFAQAVKNSGVNLVTLSTNHGLDYGVDGLQATKETLRELEFDTVGDNLGDNSVMIKNVKGTKIAFLSYTYGVENQTKKSKEELAAINIYSEEKAKKELEYAKENADYIFVIMHWGEPYATTPSNQQKEIADFFVKNGANVILGNHPAAIQPMEIRKNEEEKNVLVAYSLGNYISSIANDISKVELVLNIELRKSGQDGTVVLSKVDYTPIYVLDHGAKAENRYELIDMKGVARAYADGNQEIVTKKIYHKLIEGLKLLEKVIPTEKEE